MLGQRNAVIAKLCGAALLAAGLSGCVQATRHSNAIVFGTNTSLGVFVGTGSASVPAINIGYNRQEAVFLPLLANTRDTAEVVRGEERQIGALQPLLSPCNIDPNQGAGTVLAGGGANRPTLTPEQRIALAQAASSNPCLFVARRYDDNGQPYISDAYSVLASFGGEASGGQGSTPTGNLGVAQYFATGAAAQILAQVGTALPNKIGDAETESRAATDNTPAVVPTQPPPPALPALPAEGAPR